MIKYSILKQFILIGFVTLATAFTGAAQNSGDKFSTEASIGEDLKSNVCKNEQRLEAVRKLFKKMGATDAEIATAKFKNVENLVVTKKGKSAEAIVVGAHYDMVSEGCGAIDNWTGITIIANLYRTLRKFTTEKTYVFVAFDKEELGLLGSEAMADAIPKEKRADYCAMVNLDSFGLAYPQVLTNTTDGKLTELAKTVSKEMKIPFAEASIDASADSLSFKNHKIPAITLHGLNADWRKYIHSSQDKLENINVASVLLGYQYALNFLIKTDSANCAAFRK